MRSFFLCLLQQGQSLSFFFEEATALFIVFLLSGVIDFIMQDADDVVLNKLEKVGSGMLVEFDVDNAGVQGKDDSEYWMCHNFKIKIRLHVGRSNGDR